MLTYAFLQASISGRRRRRQRSCRTTCFTTTSRNTSTSASSDARSNDSTRQSTDTQKHVQEDDLTNKVVEGDGEETESSEEEGTEVQEPEHILECQELGKISEGDGSDGSEIQEPVPEEERTPQDEAGVKRTRLRMPLVMPRQRRGSTGSDRPSTGRGHKPADCGHGA